MIKEETIQFLKTKIDNGIVKISFTDGEEMNAKILSVSESEQDVICDVLSSSHPNRHLDKKGTCLIHFDEIESIS